MRPVDILFSHLDVMTKTHGILCRLFAPLQMVVKSRVVPLHAQCNVSNAHPHLCQKLSCLES